MKLFHFPSRASCDFRRHCAVWMNLPGDQTPVWTGQEDLLHCVLPINCSDTRVDETAAMGPLWWKCSHILSCANCLKTFCARGFHRVTCLISCDRHTNAQTRGLNVVIERLFNSSVILSSLVCKFAERNEIDLRNNIKILFVCLWASKNKTHPSWVWGEMRRGGRGGWGTSDVNTRKGREKLRMAQKREEAMAGGKRRESLVFVIT